ncbi:MAG TPA: SusC/RagA family TonB-linked outer membrane protein [Puia sp.]|jgi:TonB-linked SusC/RagA family outer membrane protein
MKLTALLLVVACVHVSAHSYSQTVSFSGNNVPLNTVFSSIEKQTGLSFFFNYALIKDTKPVTLNVQDVPFEEALNLILQGEGLDFYRTGKTIFIVKRQIGAEEPASNSESASAEQVNIRGRVTNNLGESLVAATVFVKDGKKATLTNERGEFELKNVAIGTILEISYLGYQRKVIEVEKGESIMIQLFPSNNQLDEIHVIAYGQTTQRLSTANITMVKGKDIEMQPVNNPLLALEGRVPGLFITQSNGLPGAGVKVRIQGQNSMVNGTDPLYVIDGVPYTSHLLTTTYLGPLGTSQSGPGSGIGNPMSFINPSDIESIEVLKDADATAIYGSRAANGAILITTKKGKIGKSKTTFNLQNGWGAAIHRLPLMNTQQYLEMRHEALNNDGITGPGTYDYDINGAWDTTRNTDWQKILIGGTAQYTNVNGSVSGGNANTQYLIGGTYYRESTVFPGDFSDVKGSLHFNLNTVSNNQKLKVQLTGSYLIDNNRLPISDLTGQAITLAPDAPALYKPDGTLNWQLDPTGASTWTNPLSFLYREYQNKTYNLIGNGNLSYAILPGLEIKTNLGYTSLRTNEFSGTSLLSLDPLTQALLGTRGRSAAFSYSTIDSWIFEPQVDYKMLLGSGKAEFLVGSTLHQINSNGFSISGTGYNSDALLADIRSAATVNTAGNSVYSTYKYNALFSRINYSFKDKYILNLSARRDGSSRFGPANQFHDFYSIGAGWIFSEENAIKDKLTFISFGKLRGSYGTTGNDQIGDYQFMNLYNSVVVGVPYQSTTGLSVTSLPNPYLQWEETKKLQGGVELGFLKNRIFLIANYAKNRSSNQLLALALPYITGFSTVATNLPAKIENSEVELALNTTNFQNTDFTWTSSINLTVPRNKLLAYYGVLPSYLSIGQPIAINKVFNFKGVDPSTGVFQFADSHGGLTSTPDPVNDATKVINTGFPKYYGGFQNTIRYKIFQLDVLFQFVKQIGGNYFLGQLLPGGLVNQPTYVLNRWRKPGDITTTERYNSDFSLFPQFLNALNSDIAFSDASYIRLKNVSFSIDAPSKWLHSMHFQTLKLYMRAQNLLTLTKFKGADPETGSGGLPPLRVLTIGLQTEL